MKLETTFPLSFYINLGIREDRRRECLLVFENHQLQVERMPAVNARYVRNTRGMGDVSRYSCGLSKRLCVRAARKRGASAVLIFEDDVVFHAQLRSKLAKLTLPEDWGMFYLGCLHTRAPIAVAPGLVRVTRANDNHAVAVRAKYFREVLRKLRPRGRTAVSATVPNSDILLAELHRDIPTYAAWPNLAWQRSSYSNNVGGITSNYGPCGNQLICQDTQIELPAQMRALRELQ